jgi:hypothetical protein
VLVSRVLSAAAVICLLTATAWAQQGGRGSGPARRPPPPPTSSVLPGLRSASLPDQFFAPPAPDVFIAGPRTYTPRRDRFGRDLPPYGYSGYYGDVYPYPMYGSFPDPVRDYQRAGRPASGYLALQVEPPDAQVLVDGFYVGTADDVRRGGGALTPGPHQVELRAAGHSPQSFNVLIAAGETIAYRASLASIPQPAAAPPPSPAVPKTFYVIPGCYAGDRHPRDARLVPGCDVSQLRIVPPTVGTVVR